MDRARKAELYRNLADSARNLAGLERQRADLALRLADALSVQAWQPDAFATGPCRIVALGVPHAKAAEMRLELHLATGETRTFRLLDVPRDAWPAAMRERSK